MTARPVTRILFVCLGNICRSPLAEGVFADVAARAGRSEDFLLDSAGTGGWHVGSAPDPRSVGIAAQHGIDISGQRCRQVSDADFERFDLILAMDRSNLDDLETRAPLGSRARIALFLEAAQGSAGEVPDPYYGGRNGFADVYQMIREASESLLEKLGAGRDRPSVNGQASSIT